MKELGMFRIRLGILCQDFGGSHRRALLPCPRFPVNQASGTRWVLEAARVEWLCLDEVVEVLV